MKALKITIPLVLILLVGGCFLMRKYKVNPPINLIGKSYDGELPINSIKVPEGFKVDVFAENVENARSLCLSPSGTLFVGNRGGDKVLALKDLDGDGKAEKQYVLYSDGNMPNGVAYKDGDLYIAEVNRILKISDVESKLENPGTPEVIYDQYPTDKHHGWKYIAFGPDGKLYVPVGAPCNVCDREEEIYNTITRINPDGTDMEIVVDGVRNTVGFGWHPVTQELWFSDNGRDMWGDDKPGCELNRVTTVGQHFGFPYCHQGDLLDDEFGKGKSCEDYIAPVQVLDAHVAPLGIEFTEGGKWPKGMNDKVLIAEHGSWNRSTKSGYRITMVTLDENHNATSYENFATGWLNDEDQDVWGRPVDMEWMPDGSLLVSDDFAEAIYRISYVGQ